MGAGTGEPCSDGVCGKEESEVVRSSVPELECEAAILLIFPALTEISPNRRAAFKIHEFGEKGPCAGSGPAALQLAFGGFVSVARPQAGRVAPVSTRPCGFPRRETLPARLGHTSTEVGFSFAEHR